MVWYFSRFSSSHIAADESNFIAISTFIYISIGIEGGSDSCLYSKIRIIIN